MSFDFSTGTIILIIGLTLVSALIQSASGIGYAGLFMLIMPTILGYSSALAHMYVCYSIVMLTTIIYTFRKVDIKKLWKIAFPCLITNVFGIIIGTISVKAIEQVNSDILMLILGFVLAGVSIYFFIFSKKVKITPTVPKGLALGAFGGLMSGLVGLGGPPISIYLLNATDDANEYLASLQIPYFAGNIVGIATHLLTGNVTPLTAGAIVLSLVPTLGGCIFGLWLANKVNGTVLKRIVYAVMLGMGILLIVQHI